MAPSLSLNSDAASFSQLVICVTTPFNNNSTQKPATFIICRTCHVILTFPRVKNHFREGHSLIDTRLLQRAFQAWQHSAASTHLTITTEEELNGFSTPPNVAVPPIPYLPTEEAYWCNQTLPSGDRCGCLSRQLQRMRNHCREKHGWITPRNGLGAKGRLPHALEKELKAYPLPYDSMVPAQQLARTGTAGAYFPVLQSTVIASSPSTQPNPSAPLYDYSEFETASDSAKEGTEEFTTLSRRYPALMSPWIDHTGWVRILEGVDLRAAAALLNPPTSKDRGLQALLQAFDQVIVDTLLIIENNSVNEFVLKAINAYWDGPKAGRRPLHYKLLPSTWRIYQSHWHKLLTYVWRVAIQHSATNLPEYKLNDDQSASIRRVLSAIETSDSPLLSPTQPSHSSPSTLWSSSPTTSTTLRPRHKRRSADRSLAEVEESEESDCDSLYNSPSEYSVRNTSPPPTPEILRAPDSSIPITKELKSACIQLCCSLLNHRLPGRLTESLVITFLAVLGISPDCQSLLEANGYTPKLSGLVKCGQLVVLAQAINEQNDGGDTSTDLLMLVKKSVAEYFSYKTATPVDKILSMRAYGEVLRRYATADGDLVWSADHQRLTMKEMSFTMTSLRWWVQDLTQKARELLFNLLFIPSGDKPDTRYKMLPPLDLHAISDNFKNEKPMYSFVQDSRNKAMFSDTYRLNRRVGDHPEFHGMFDPLAKTWCQKGTEAYCKTRYEFLCQLLLLFHITGGQPARGTELLSISWCNPRRHGDTLRNIFIEEGKVVFMTKYHKSYSLTSTPKVIQRYLPKEVGELYVYYVWLVMPFLDGLRKDFMKRGKRVDMLEESSCYLWSISTLPNARKRFPDRDKSANQVNQSSSSTARLERPPTRLQAPWPSTCLERVIEEGGRQGLHTKVNIRYWRSGAVGIACVHLPVHLVQQHYNYRGSNAVDAQAGHTTETAGRHYARGKNEHAFSTRHERSHFGEVSHHWHKDVLAIG